MCKWKFKFTQLVNLVNILYSVYSTIEILRIQDILPIKYIVIVKSFKIDYLIKIIKTNF